MFYILSCKLSYDIVNNCKCNNCPRKSNSFEGSLNSNKLELLLLFYSVAKVSTAKVSTSSAIPDNLFSKKS